MANYVDWGCTRKLRRNGRMSGQVGRYIHATIVDGTHGAFDDDDNDGSQGQ